MTREHTPEPWDTQSMPSILECKRRGDWMMLHSSDWFRARACVNACASYDDPSEVPSREEWRAVNAAKGSAYSERNQLVAALSKVFPASLERHPDDDESWEDDWRWIVFIDLPTGQATWHIHDSEVDLFAHLGRLRGREWDGHSTEEKYERVRALGGLEPGDTLRIPSRAAVEAAGKALWAAWGRLESGPAQRDRQVAVEIERALAHLEDRDAE